MKPRTFVDHIRVFARAGDGGDGSGHFRRGKFAPKGGPDGGDGGRGGDVVLEVAANTDNLVAFLYKSKLVAEHGRQGGHQQMTGRSGRDCVARVPPGTLVFRADEERAKVARPEEELELVADLTDIGQRFVLALGGKGGKGNVHFKSPTNQAPATGTPGEDGDEGWFYFELRQIADAGLVGFPNAGKSTLLGALSEAKPRVAAYPFTTLQPMIGVLEFPGFRRATVADIPGLIEGAHANVGLGHEFLRHILRCALLLFVVDSAGSEGRDPVADIEMLRAEIGLYDKRLAARPWMIVANKIDLPEADDGLARLRARFPKTETLAISAAAGDGLAALKSRLAELIGKRPE